MNTHICLSPNGVDTYHTAAEPTSLLVGTMDGVVELRASPGTGRWETVNRTLDGLHVEFADERTEPWGAFRGSPR